MLFEDLLYFKSIKEFFEGSASMCPLKFFTVSVLQRNVLSLLFFEEVPFPVKVFLTNVYEAASE